MKAIIINPHDETITEVENDGSLDAIYEATDSKESGIDAVTLNPVTIMYVDDNGMFKPDQRFFILVPGAPVIAGKAIIYGLDDFGNNRDHPGLDLDKIRPVIQWPEIEFTGMVTSEGEEDHPILGPMHHIRSVSQYRHRVTKAPWYPPFPKEDFADSDEGADGDMGGGDTPQAGDGSDAI